MKWKRQSPNGAGNGANVNGSGYVGDTEEPYSAGVSADLKAAWTLRLGKHGEEDSSRPEGSGALGGCELSITQVQVGL